MLEELMLLAKLPISNATGGFLTLNVNALTAANTFYERPVERIQKIRVKFRHTWHFGKLLKLYHYHSLYNSTN